MATEKEVVGFQYGKKKYFFRHVIDKGHESFRLEGFNGELLDEKSSRAKGEQRIAMSFKTWVRQSINRIMDDG